MDERVGVLLGAFVLMVVELVFVAPMAAFCIICMDRLCCPSGDDTQQ